TAYYYFTEVYALDEHSGNYYYEYDGVEYTDKGKGKYSYVFNRGGVFKIRITLVEEDPDKDYYDRYYSDECTVTVSNIGPQKRNFALLIDTSTEIVTDRAEFIDATVKEDGYYWWYLGDGEVAIDGNRITGLKAGRVTLVVRYRLENGEIREAEVRVDVTDPVYTPFSEKYYLAGNYLYPDISGESGYSEVTYETDNENICSYTGFALFISGPGTCNITITVDGRRFTDTITTYSPTVSDEALLIKKKKTHKITVDGLPEDITPKYRSANKKVATVSADGTVKAKAAGSTYITITCGDLIEYSCYVTVGKGGKAFNAAKAAYDFIGGKYSQDERMKDGYFDCSSLVWRAYKEAGVYLAGETKYAPTAADLAKKLEKEGKAIAYEYIEADELKPGDLIFYSSGSNGRYMNIDHVSIYYAAACSPDWYGEVYNTGLIVHATSPAVHLSSYGYSAYNIVMICRPVD
ncbi:MAG: Ig-like domain-containing protein, partial [Lachnospiraceae bacterium]|nr:Ig-like domain-containing protein [Lachnospiraceae bacterium]